jgi:peptidoglycan hydrolase-like protein with peptidoglycan-binding domain
MKNSRCLSLVFLASALFPFLAFAQTTPQSTCPNLTRSLSIGFEGSDVVQLQNFLIAQNLLPQGDNTGYFGHLTQAAAIAFQGKQSLPTTGFVGPLTRAAISKVCGVTEISNKTVAPVPDTFYASPNSGMAPLEVAFAYDDPTPGHSYTITFGDGSSGTLITNYGTTPPGCANCHLTPSYNATHTYDSGGTYNAKVIDAYGDVLNTAIVTITSAPEAILISAPGSATLSLHQSASWNTGFSQDTIELTDILSNGVNDNQSANIQWQSVGGNTKSGGESDGTLYLNSAQSTSWQTPDGYTITLTSINGSSASFQISD